MKRQEKMLKIAGKVRESFHKEKKHLTPYSGTYSFLLKVYIKWAGTIYCIENSSQNGNSYFHVHFYEDDDSCTCKYSPNTFAALQRA
jgi:hypothetical protein